MLVGPLKASKHPMRINDGAERVRAQSRSHGTGRAGREMRDKARVMGISRACMAIFFYCLSFMKGWKIQVKCAPSEQRYSRIEERRTANPSADREKAVRDI
jgi:hypothetical protein